MPKPYWTTVDNRTVRLYQGDVLAVLPRLPSLSVQCVVTSPPYHGLLDYKSDKSLEIGSESTSAEYLTKMVEVFREVRRVLRDDGTVWLNMGDSYGDKGNLLGMPWRLAFALQDDGWILRQDIIWAKKSPMPESVKNRCTKAHEYVFLFAKKAGYYYDAEAIKDPGNKVPAVRDKSAEPYQKSYDGRRFSNGERQYGIDGKSNKRSVWTIPDGSLFNWLRANQPEVLAEYLISLEERADVWRIASQGYEGAHFATFPEKLVEPCILAGTSAYGACTKCGAPWKRRVARS